MKVLSIDQPGSSLCLPAEPGAKPVKTIETRSWSTKHRGLVALASTEQKPTLGDIGINQVAKQRGEFWLMHRDCGYVHPLPLGVILGTVNLVDVVPIVGPDDNVLPAGSPCVVVDADALTLWDAPDYWYHEQDERDITDQLPYGDFAPGRFAWLFTDAKLTTERCPACGGTGYDPVWRLDPECGGVHPVDCPTCDGKGTCEPIPVKGRQGLWTWEAA